ncbi:MAG: amidase family protein, partial [Janthinobacterium lividum]
MSSNTSTNPLWHLSASATATLIRRGDVSAREVALAALERVNEVNGAINAIVDFRPEHVLEQAAAVDAQRAAGGALGPLAGVPITTKVNADQKGYATTNGLVGQKDLIAQESAPVIQNLINAGAVVLGRTNTPAFSYRWFTNNLLHGHTRNPRNPDLTPGGSSGGASAAVAAGMGAIAHGTDIAGSVRYPAYACGVHGLRPSLGRVPTFSSTAKVERGIGGQLMSVAGPLARSVHDLRLAFQAMSCPSTLDPWYVPLPFAGEAVPRRAAVCLKPDGMETHPLVCKALLESAQKLRDAGWIVDEVDNLPPLQEAVPVQIILWLADGYAGLVAAAEKEGDPGAIAVLAAKKAFAESIGLPEFCGALAQRATIARAWQRFLMEEYAVVLLPVSADLPFADGLDAKSEEDQNAVWKAQLPMVALPVAGVPCLSLATGLVENSTPVGIQIVAARFR